MACKRKMSSETTTTMLSIALDDSLFDVNLDTFGGRTEDNRMNQTCSTIGKLLESTLPAYNPQSIYIDGIPSSPTSPASRTSPIMMDSIKLRSVPSSASSTKSHSSDDESTDASYLRTWFQRDVRRIYPKLLVDAMNSFHLDHLKNCVNLMCQSECELMFLDLHLKGCDEIFQFYSNTMNVLPDGVFSINNFKLKQVSHLPKYFDEFAQILLINQNNVDLDEYLLQIAQQEGVQPTRGFVIYCSYSLTGSQLISESRSSPASLPSMSSSSLSSMSSTHSSLSLSGGLTSKSMCHGYSMKFIESTSKIPQSKKAKVYRPSFERHGLTIWTLNSFNKITRMEYHVDEVNV